MKFKTVLQNLPNTASRKYTGIMHSILERASGTGWWESARFHLCLRQGAGKQFAWLGVDSVKVAFSRSAHQRVSREDHTGRAASRWAADYVSEVE